MRREAGTLRFFNGDLYEGEWRNDQKEGQGGLELWRLKKCASALAASLEVSLVALPAASLAVGA
jgi:hypothetical protein